MTFHGFPELFFPNLLVVILSVSTTGWWAKQNFSQNRWMQLMQPNLGAVPPDLCGNMAITIGNSNSLGDHKGLDLRTS